MSLPKGLRYVSRKRKVNADQHEEMKRLHKEGLSYDRIGSIFNLSATQVSKIVRGIQK